MRRAGVLAVASALVSFVVPAAAATAGGSGAVVDSDRSASWQGRVDRDGPPRWDVPECRSAG
ncbi:MAG: hypothetical protein HOV94_37685, partial [Saccharothrix sp.]|nr:hypothetical protein [Saccharothrix sp.]